MPTTEPSARRIKLAQIDVKASIQTRASINPNTVDDYADLMAADVEFPPVALYGPDAEGSYFVGDGFHRIAASRKIGRSYVLAIVTPGGRMDALRHSLLANVSHGLRRTNVDKRRAVELAFEYAAELSPGIELSNRMIADMAGVSDDLVISVRRLKAEAIVEAERASQVSEPAPVFTLGRDGKRYPARQPAPSPEIQIDHAGKTEDVSEAVPEAVDEVQLELARAAIHETRRASTSMIQRRLRIGYTAAVRLMDVMQARGWVGPENGNEPREILPALDDAWNEPTANGLSVGMETADGMRIVAMVELPASLDAFNDAVHAAATEAGTMIEFDHTSGSLIVKTPVQEFAQD